MMLGQFAPGFPGRGAARPDFVQQLHFAIGIHALPESGMLVHRKLPLGGERFQHALLEADVVAVRWDAIERRLFEYEKAAVDPALRDLRLLAERADDAAVDRKLAVARRGMHGGHGREPS